MNVTRSSIPCLLAVTILLAFTPATTANYNDLLETPPSASCVVEVPQGGSGSCTDTWYQDGPISVTLYAYSGDALAYGDRLAAGWIDSLGYLIEERHCKDFVHVGGSAVDNSMPPYSTSASHCGTEDYRDGYYIGTQTLHGEVQGATCVNNLGVCTFVFEANVYD